MTLVERMRTGMASPPRGGGRPAAPPSTGSEAVDALVLLLRDVRKQSGLSIEDVHELLRVSGQLSAQLPARSTLYRKLSGVGLMNERRLVEAVVGVCVSDERRADAVRERAVDLLHQAWLKDAEPVPPRPGGPGGDDGSMAELVRVQRELIGVQAQLAAALQTAAEAEKEAARSRALVTTLLVLGAIGAAAHADGPVSSPPSEAPSGLRARLADTEAERDLARQAARAAARRLAEGEHVFVARDEGSRGPTTAAPREWPTTRMDPVSWTASAHAPARGTGRAVRDTTASYVKRDPEQGAMSLVEWPAPEGVRALEQDSGLAEVLAEMLRLDPDGSRLGSAIDGAGRHLLDPVHTGRYLWSQLAKAEKIGLGTIVCQRIQRELGLADGLQLDFMVAGHEVDVKFTLGGNWMFPPDLQGGLCLVVRADDASGLWSLGLLRVSSELMRTGANRDGKRGLSAEGRGAIHWVHRDLPLPEHALRRLPDDVIGAIFAKPSGQARTEELFQQAQLTAITTADLSAITMQADGVKRAREARRRLARRGVLVLNGSLSRDGEWASALGLPVLAPSTWMSVRLVPTQPEHDDSPTITLDDTPWRVARPGDVEAPLPAAALG
ncbi:NaeI family type II restriction endonuclease [Streptomyces sp. NPDC090133]|uniref:NaeI family type II restriction endonuclease n=2 Tax=Streptomyces TaxID=1883 RepID=UPI0037F8C20C